MSIQSTGTVKWFDNDQGEDVTIAPFLWKDIRGYVRATRYDLFRLKVIKGGELLR